MKKSEARKVFNTTVENSVEKRDGISVSDSARDGSAFCTGASAGTLVVLLKTAVLESVALLISLKCHANSPIPSQP
jgi:hypothetical protein